MLNKEFTYVVPNNQLFYDGLLKQIKDDKKYIYDIIKNGYCILNGTNNFTCHYWNEYCMYIHFYIKHENIKKITEEIKIELKNICNELIPVDAGYEVMKLFFKQNITQSEYITSPSTINAELDSTLENIPIISTSIKKDADNMAKIYIQVYYIENILRYLLEFEAKNILGENYFNKLEKNKNIMDTITKRKITPDKWVSQRGSDIFYLDLSQLSQIIINNWKLFEKYFPSQAWIQTKISEIYACRNNIAHNSYLSDTEIILIENDIHIILKQINGVFKSQNN